MTQRKRDITQLLEFIREGRPGARSRLFDQVHSELHRRARKVMRGQRADHTLQSTALVNEVYIRMMGRGKTPWSNRKHFLAVAAKAMRQVLVDHARRQHFPKSERAAPVLEEVAGLGPATIDSMALNDSLERLADFDPEMASAIELRVFTGMSREETARALNLAPRTFDRRWQAARAWLLSDMS